LSQNEKKNYSENEINDKVIDGPPSKKSSVEYSDLLSSQSGPKAVDSETLIKDAQKRIWASLKKGFEYNPTYDESEAFLRQHVSSRMHMIVLYVDLVGSTDITLSLPEEKVAKIMGSFAQEMAGVITNYGGYVLKFVGDAVIGYFIAESTSLMTSDNAVNCAKTMIQVIEKGINPILNQYDYPELKIKIGMDYGENMIVRYGSDKASSHVDILGPAMNIASKIEKSAEPNQILIGDDVYTRLHPSIQKSFEKVVWKKTRWKYHDRETGKLYPVFAYRDQTVNLSGHSTCS